MVAFITFCLYMPTIVSATAHRHNCGVPTAHHVKAAQRQQELTDKDIWDFVSGVANYCRRRERIGYRLEDARSRANGG